MNIRMENWMGHEIRFVEIEVDEWRGVATDVAEALGYSHTPHMVRMIDADEKDDVRLVDSIGRKQKFTVISETGIYEAIFNSQRPETKDFKKWVKQIMKTIRQSTGLEGFQIFRMLDKEHQKEAMTRLKEGFHDTGKPDFIKANTIANKAVSTMYGYPKMIKKDQMTPEMLVRRQDVLDDTVNLMSIADKFGLDIKVSNTIYNKYNDKSNRSLPRKRVREAQEEAK